MPILEALGIDVRLFVAQVINFVLLLFLLQRFLYRPVIGILEERERRIKESLMKAEEAERAFVRTKKERDALIRRAREEARAIIAEARDVAEHEANELKQKAKEEIRRFLDSAKRQAQEERERVIRDIERDLASLVVTATERVVGAMPVENVHDRLVREAIEEIKI